MKGPQGDPPLPAPVRAALAFLAHAEECRTPFGDLPAPEPRELGTGHLDAEAAALKLLKGYFEAHTDAR